MCYCQKRYFDTEKYGVGSEVIVYFECGSKCKCIEGEIIGCSKTPCCGGKAIKIRDCYGKIFNIDCDKISHWTTKDCGRKYPDEYGYGKKDKDYDGYSCGRKDYDGYDCDCGRKDYDGYDCGRRDYDGCSCERKDYDGHDCDGYYFDNDDCDCCD